ncbi:MAG TPA: cytochrome c oxidase assembly protein [Alphaproteobacteria bacterium]|nr:cytochrome c oxidase assembly protein [Alphaproteobacteria bacterium]
MNKNSQTALNIAAVVIGMFGLAYASVPLYDAFCRLTGYGGTPNTSVTEAPTQIYDREIKVMFNTDVSPALNLEFKALQSKVTVKVGEQKLAFFTVENLSDKDDTLIATYNVVPETTGSYFVKLKCFCFDKQLIKARQKITFPVSFFIDPEIMNDKELDNVKTITLSYTFFRSE